MDSNNSFNSTGRNAARSRSRSPVNYKDRSYGGSPDYGRGRRGFRRGRSASPGDRKQTSGPVNRVFVSNIPFECRWMDLKDLFREKVGDVSFVELYEDDFGKSKGCGVVEFKTAETAQKAIEIMHQYEYKGRPLYVKEDLDFDRGKAPPRGGPQKPSEREFLFREKSFDSSPPFNTYGLNPEFLKSLGISGPLTNKIFISNLDYKVTERKLDDIFKISGKLTKMSLKVDKDGKSKGHATGEFEHPLEAVQAISMFNGQRLYSRIMNVRMDKFSDESEPLPSKLPTGLYGIGKGLGAGGLPMQFPSNVGAGIPSSMGVGSSNLGMLSSSSMGLGSGGSMGMSSPITSERTLMNSSALGMGLSGSSMGMSSSPVGMGMGGSPGLGPSSIDAIGREGSFRLGTSSSGRGYRDGFERSNDSFGNSYASDTVLLSNIPSSFSWQALKDKFRDVGDVRFAEVKGQGTALIRFNSVQDAQRAVDLMNGVRIDGRVIQVRLY